MFVVCLSTHLAPLDVFLCSLFPNSLNWFCLACMGGNNLCYTNLIRIWRAGLSLCISLPWSISSSLHSFIIDSLVERRFFEQLIKRSAIFGCHSLFF